MYQSGGRRDTVALKISVVISLMGFILLLAASVQAQTFAVLYTFTGGIDGGVPYGGLAVDDDGNLYGTTSQGGSPLSACPLGCGVVFKVDSAGNETVLHSFGEVITDGAIPLYEDLLRDRSGNLYGTTMQGGATGNGTAFRLSTSGRETVFSFSGGTQGGFPYPGLAADVAGNFYGTTSLRGTGCPPYGCGTVFKLNRKGKESVLHNFTGGADGKFPNGLAVDKAGNVYGTTVAGGSGGAGVVYKVDATGKETVLYAFRGDTDGGFPQAGPIVDKTGNLYITTAEGGLGLAGTIFKIDSSGTPSVLYTFCPIAPCDDGAAPNARLVRDAAGNLYGTTFGGGAFNYGVIFRLDNYGTLWVLHSFDGSSDGGLPLADLVRDHAGNLYGTTASRGAYGYGTVFKLTPQ